MLDRALRAGKLLNPEWTTWIYTGTRARSTKNDYPIGVAGGGPGVSAGLESDGELTAIVLANVDPPIGDDLARQLFRALSSGS